MIDTFETYFLCVVHIVDFVKSDNSAKFYSTFINSILPFVKEYNGKLVRTINEDIVFYFPDTSNMERQEAFDNALQCCLAIIYARTDFNKVLVEDGLPEISYNISADYFNLNLRLYKEKSIPFEIFRGAINFCLRMNKVAPTNCIIVGQDLHAIFNHFSMKNGYRFQKLPDLHYGNKSSYPVYLVSLEKS